MYFSSINLITDRLTKWFLIPSYLFPFVHHIHIFESVLVLKYIVPMILLIYYHFILFSSSGLTRSYYLQCLVTL